MVVGRLKRLEKQFPRQSDHCEVRAWEIVGKIGGGTPSDERQELSMQWRIYLPSFETEEFSVPRFPIVLQGNLSGLGASMESAQTHM